LFLGDITELANTIIDDGHICAVSEDSNPISSKYEFYQVINHCIGIQTSLSSVGFPFSLQSIYSDFINFEHPEIAKKKLNPDQSSFNVGVYVMDVDRWRAANITEDALYWTELNSRY
jgi:lipopolysaccharide biosynthesis glycosyltransferase